MEYEKAQRETATDHRASPLAGDAAPHSESLSALSLPTLATRSATPDTPGDSSNTTSILLDSLPVTVLDALPDAVFLYDCEGQVVVVNHRAREVFGVHVDPAFFSNDLRSRVTRIAPRTLEGRPLPEDQWHVTRLIHGEVITGEAPLNVLITTLDGAEIALSFTGAPITAPGTGQLVGAIAVARDITEQQRAARERERALRDEQAARALAEETARELRAIQAVSDVALADLDPDTLMQALLTRVREALQGDSAAILLRAATEGPESEVLVIRAAQGMEVEVADRVRVAVGKGFAGRIVAENRAVVVPDFKSFDVENPFLRERLRSAIGAPLSVKGKVFGAIHVDSAAPRTFTPEEIRLLEVVANRVALAIDRSQTQRQADEAAATARGLAAEMETVFQSMTDGVTLFDVDGTIRQMNRAYQRVLGLEDEGLAPSVTERGAFIAPRRPDGTALPQEQWPAIRILNGETLTGERAPDVLVRSYDGRELLLNCAGAPVRGANGNVIAGVMVIREISERRQLESLARHAQGLAMARARELESIIEVMSDAVVVVDLEGRITQRNSAALRLYAQSTPADWTTRTMRSRTSSFDLYTAEGRRMDADEWPAARALRGDTISTDESGDVYYYNSDGREVWLNAAAAPLRDDNGDIIGAVVVYRDVTARRQLERRTRQSLEAVLAMAGTLVDLPRESESKDRSALEADAARAEESVAQRLAQLTAEVLGCTRVGIIAVEPLTDRMRAIAVVGLEPEQEQLWWEEQRALEAAGARISDGASAENLARFRRGEVFVIDMRDERYRDLPNPYHITTQLIAPMRIGDELVGMISLDFGGAPHDFTDAERELADAVARIGAVALERDRLLRDRAEARAKVMSLAETNEQMNTFVGIAGHELRTPLTSAKANIQMAARIAQRLAAGNAEPTSVDRLLVLTQRIESQLLRQERLVEDLLDVSRIQEGKLQLRLSECDLTQLVRGLTQEIQEQYPERRIKTHLPAGGATMVWADADRVGQAITNYLTNALKYSAADTVVQARLTVAGRYARFVVRDQGPGLPADEQQRIWDRFHRSPGIKVQSGSHVGLGLGLYITREMIERQGGAVGVESAPGKGSAFWFTLPLVRQAPEADH